MEVRLTPRQMAKGILKGELPPRPLVLPIVFSLGAKVENVSPAAFLKNPTKIASALRQMRSHLQTDGVACYFDRYLEVEALGATLEYKSEGEPPEIRWPGSAAAGEIPSGLRSPEDAAQHGRIPIAAEVIRRMNSLPNREFLLMVGVTGPMALTAQLTHMGKSENPELAAFPAEALELASSVVTQIATTFLEAGSDMVFLQEKIPAGLSGESCEQWANLLVPAINVARFYEALPVLLLGQSNSASENWEMILRQRWDCLVCAPLGVMSSRRMEGSPAAQGTPHGISLPLEIFASGNASSEGAIANLREAVAQCRPVIITTAGDAPFATDMKQLKKVFEEIARGW
jgi:hypothetical protein